MATLTYDPTPADQPEFSAEEQESIQIGEQLEQEQQEMLAGKYRSAEELERAYIELQQKFSSRDDAPVEEEGEEPVQQEEEQVEETDSGILDQLWQASQNEEVSQELIEALNNMSAEDLAAEYMEYRNNAPEDSGSLSEADVTELQNIAGGPQEYQAMVEWASQNLSEQEIDMFDQVMGKGDPFSAYFAIQTLNNTYQNSVGYEGQMLGGRQASEPGDGFRSQSELVRAMSDPRYEQDPAYRDDIARKLERSSEIMF